MKLLTMMKSSFFYQAIKYLLGLDALEQGPRIAATESLSAALLHLKRRYSIYRPNLARFLIRVYEHLLQQPKTLPIPLGNNSLIIHVCYWGESYSDKADKYLFPSLLTDQNLPALSKEYNITLLIHCDQQSRGKIKRQRKKITQYANLQLIDIPKSIITSTTFKHFHIPLLMKWAQIKDKTKYFLLGCLQSHALEIALKNKTYISFLMPDMVLSDTFFLEAFKHIENRKAVVTGTFRTNFQKVKPRLEKFYNTPKAEALTITPSNLNKLQLNCIHPAAKTRIVCESTVAFRPSAQLLFKTPHGFIIRAFHYHPMLINCARINKPIKIDYYPVDKSILSKIISNNTPYDQQIWVCNDANIMSSMELSDENLDPATSKHTRLTYQQLIQAINTMILTSPESYSMPLHRYLAAIRLRIESNTVVNTGKLLDDNEFFSDLYSQYQINSKCSNLATNSQSNI
ncbi:MAG: hypothetical protein K0U12_02145 [Gammaproteobacteria bacterium]|nr:hypothetical protein [Gammaproteobacteria bacterium]